MKWVPWAKFDRMGLARYISAAAGKTLRLAEARGELLQQKNGRALVCEAIYDALLARDLRYSTEPYDADRRSQSIRSPSELLSGAGNGTCLDLAALFAGACLHNELLPLLVVVKGHAFVLVSLDFGRSNAVARPRLDQLGEWANSGILHGERGDDAALLKALMQDSAWLSVECTGFALSNSMLGSLPEGRGRVNGRMSFAQACTSAAEHAENFVNRPFEFAIDIALIHDSGMTPYDHEAPWRLGYLWTVPARDTGYVKRPALVDQILGLLLERAPSEASVRKASAPIMLCGSGGVGKTTVTIAVCCDSRVQETFPDGIIWLHFGQNPSVLNMLNEMINMLSGGADNSGQRRQDFATSVNHATQQLAELVTSRRLLIVIDDVWQASHLLPFLVGSATCRLLVSSRDFDVAKAVKAKILSAPVMTAIEARQLLVSKCADIPEIPDLLLDRLAKVLGYLPLALDLSGQRLDDGYPIEDLLHDLTSEISRLDVMDRSNFRQETNEAVSRQLSLNASINLSLLCMEGPLQKAFAWLGVLRDGMHITAECAATLWSTDLSTARRDLFSLASKSLLQRAALPGESCQHFALHDVMHAKARNLLFGGALQGQRDGIDCLGIAPAAAHALVLQNYCQKLAGSPWHAIKRDGYIEYNLIHHMRLANCQGDLFDLLGMEYQSRSDGICTNGWYWFREQAGETEHFVSDVSAALEWALSDLRDPSKSAKHPLLIGYAVQFCAMLASVNNLGSQIDPETAISLVNSKLWTMQTALAHGRKHFRANQLTKLAANATFAIRCEIISTAIGKVQAGGTFGWKLKQFLGMLNDLDDDERMVVADCIGRLLNAQRQKVFRNVSCFFPDDETLVQHSASSDVPSDSPSAVTILDDLGCYITAYVYIAVLRSKKPAPDMASQLGEIIGIICRFDYAPALVMSRGIRQSDWIEQYRRCRTRMLYAGLTIKMEFGSVLSPESLASLTPWLETELQSFGIARPRDPVFAFRALMHSHSQPLAAEEIFCSLDNGKLENTQSDIEPDPLGRGFAEGLVRDLVRSLREDALSGMVTQALLFDHGATASECLTALGQRMDEQARFDFVDAYLVDAEIVCAWRLMCNWEKFFPDDYVGRKLYRLLQTINFRTIQTVQLEIVIEGLCYLSERACRLVPVPLLAFLRQCPVQLRKAALLRSVLPMLSEQAVRDLLPVAHAISHFESRLIAYRGFVEALSPEQSKPLLALLVEAALKLEAGPQAIWAIVDVARGLPTDAVAPLLSIALKLATGIHDESAILHALSVCTGGLAEPMRTILLSQRPFYIGLGDYQGVDRLVKSRFYELPHHIGDIGAIRGQLMASSPATVDRQQRRHGTAIATAMREDALCAQLMDATDKELVATLADELEASYELVSRAELFDIISPWVQEFNWRGEHESALMCTLGLRGCAVWWP